MKQSPSSPMTLTCAPCCWGVDDVNNPHLPAWRQVLTEAAQAGFGGLELGPYGYMPRDVDLLTAELRHSGLFIVAGTIFDDLVSLGNRQNLLEQTDAICALIRQLPTPPASPGQRYGGPYLTVMDWGHDERDFNAGHSARAPRLAPEQWHNMVSNIRAIAALAQDKYAIRTVIHPHAGGYIEFADELHRIVSDIDNDTAGLCLDTGHLMYAGMDPVATLQRYWSRVDYIHFKDINQTIFQQVLGKSIRFFDACAEGVMCPIGQGNIDYPAIHTLLREKAYAGFITIEQERDPRNTASVLDDLTWSKNYLAKIGF
ncbi:TIM barrel protein [Reinekea forsetii]|mgnify:CR=1 FL=1|jgi:inosose dehydratase|uniref:Inosose dehydratase n=2 Tax=Reinekea forsetii TaxID=1336806 RepID=A0A2K8KLI4_9GAMM|nr:TIM barrel protein [Reinekea forsetii]ATX75763.1 inosose dehydratase [Reinekea forsetii]MDO7642876.1 sugar phosphate isomerase/epimerase [Reinekea forsetii]MDO7644404.1 sugar phosphate isomerase/epimerase [Reinekea forsetii]